MKYVADVFKIKECKQTIYRHSSAYALMLISNLILLVICLVLSPVFTMFLKVGIKGTLGFAFVICLIVDISVARMMIWREPEKKYERRHNLNNNIIKYFRINEGSEDIRITDIRKVKYTLFEHYNGVPFFVIQLKLGSYKQKPISNKEFIEKLMKLFYEEKVEFLKTTELEDFTDNDAWSYVLTRLQNIESNKFKIFYLKVIEYVRGKYNKIKVPTIYYKVILKTPEQKLRCSDFVDRIQALYEDTYHNVRELKYLTYGEFMKYVTQYYEVETLDLTLSEALDDKRLKIGSSEVIKVINRKGKVIDEKQLKERKNKYIVRSIRYEKTTSKDKMIDL